MSDERYERSADMRLLELQREALGVPLRVLKSTKYSDIEPSAEPIRTDETPFVQNGAIVVAAIEAQPRTGIISGALITVSLTVANDGDQAARGVRLSLPLPASTAYRPGSFFVDGEAAGDPRAADVFAGGAELGDIEPATRRTVLLKLLVEEGLGPIVLVPHISAAIGAVLGLRAIRLTRATNVHHVSILERPFYEEVDADVVDEPAPLVPPPAAVHSTIEVIQPSEAPTSVAPPAPAVAIASPGTAPAVVTAVEPVVVAAVKPKAKPRPKSRPKAKAEAPAERAVPAATAKLDVVRSVEAPLATQAVAANAVKSVTPAAPVKPIESVRSSPPAKVAAPKLGAPGPAVEPPRAIEPIVAAAPAPAAAEPDRPVYRVGVGAVGGPILTVAVDRKRLSTLSSLFGGSSLGMIAHYLVLNALAVRDALPGDNEDGAIALFVAQQEQLLSRALIATRLGKPPGPDTLGATLPAFPSGLSLHKRRRMVDAPEPGQLVLVRSFQSSETAFLRRTLENESASPFLRAAQLFVGLCANDAIVADDYARRQLSVALSAYAALATAEVSRIFLRAKLSRNPEIFKATDPALDEAARTVLGALARAIR